MKSRSWPRKTFSRFTLTSTLATRLCRKTASSMPRMLWSCSTSAEWTTPSIFGKSDGVVHSALVLQDQSIRGMDEAVFRQSLVAKVDVSVNLEKVFRGHDLDFMLFFSSLSSFYRAAGQ